MKKNTNIRKEMRGKKERERESHKYGRVLQYVTG